MSRVNGRQPDLEEMTSNKADEIAEQRYGREFSDLPASVQMTVWMDAEREVADEIATQNDSIYDQMMEGKLFRGGNGHRPKAEREDHFLELEMSRRLGK